MILNTVKQTSTNIDKLLRLNLNPTSKSSPDFQNNHENQLVLTNLNEQNNAILGQISGLSGDVNVNQGTHSSHNLIHAHNLTEIQKESETNQSSPLVNGQQDQRMKILKQLTDAINGTHDATPVATTAALPNLTSQINDPNVNGHITSQNILNLTVNGTNETSPPSPKKIKLANGPDNNGSIMLESQDLSTYLNNINQNQLTAYNQLMTTASSTVHRQHYDTLKFLIDHYHEHGEEACALRAGVFGNFFFESNASKMPRSTNKRKSKNPTPLPIKHQPQRPRSPRRHRQTSRQRSYPQKRPLPLNSRLHLPILQKSRTR